ncbi:hypothetical protein [Paenibacillus sinopodophylli]|uniref:hypothetical protein n=1 Tax=Paenibacillus sinopodophylli TaxID=1837342 RepID=UPI00110C9615|nr:hypothetical protein [Paenibacillus sinopodophylli]
MYPISEVFLDQLRRRDRDLQIYADIDGVTYSSAQIVDFHIENSIRAGEDFQLGTTVLGMLTITLRTQDVIPGNTRIRLYLSQSLSSLTWDQATYPWNGMNVTWLGDQSGMPLGEFYVDSRKQVNDVWVFTCYDKLVWADTSYISTLSYPTTQQAVWNEICGMLGYTYDSSVQINPTYQIQSGPAGFSMRQVLGYIASANSACVFVGKDGTIKFRRFAAADNPVWSMTGADYVRIKQLNPIKTYTRFVVTYDEEDKLTYEAGSGDENHTLYVTNPFMTQAMTNALHARLNGFSYMPVDMDARGYPQLEPGDRLGIERYEGGTWLDTQTPWQDTHLPWDGVGKYQTIIMHQVFSYRGGLKMRIESPSKSEQQSEFVVKGPLTQQIDRINKDAVKYDKAYYGVTHSRNEGIVVQREDGKSKLTLNSDIMDWQVNGSSSLHYDAVANRLKFTGTLEGVDGVFSGSLQAATGTFKGELQAASGTFAGSLQAASGTFTGQLVAASGSFSGVISASSFVGGTVTGALIQTKAAGQYPRSEMSSTGNFFAVYKDVNNYLALVPIGDFNDAPGINIKQGSDEIVLGFGAGLTSTKGLYSSSEFELFMPNGLLMPGNTMWSNWTNIRNLDSGKNLQQELNGKANSGVSTSLSGGHNHGIPNGTRLAVVNASGVVTGSVIWSVADNHSHAQS